jgi:hypothetical protein
LEHEKEAIPMAVTASRKSRKAGVGTRTGVPRRGRDIRSHRKPTDVDGYGWGVDVAGEITLGGLKLILANRAGVRIQSPTRLT